MDASGAASVSVAQFKKKHPKQFQVFGPVLQHLSVFPCVQGTLSRSEWEATSKSF